MKTLPKKIRDLVLRYAAMNIHFRFLISLAIYVALFIIGMYYPKIFHASGRESIVIVSRIMLGLIAIGTYALWNMTVEKEFKKITEERTGDSIEFPKV